MKRRSPHRILRQLQLALELLYRLKPAPDIRRFVLLRARARREQLLVVEEQDLFLALEVDPSVADELQGERLELHNLPAFCLLVEAVSHFLLLVYCARQERSISALELELQAEVDKYVACLLVAARSPSLPSEHIRGRLYQGFRLVEGLDASEERRYVEANSLARRYTEALERRFVHRLDLEKMTSELRRFYRLGYQGKREIIGRR